MAEPPREQKNKEGGLLLGDPNPITRDIQIAVMLEKGKTTKAYLSRDYNGNDTLSNNQSLARKSIRKSMGPNSPLYEITIRRIE